MMTSLVSALLVLSLAVGDQSAQGGPKPLGLNHPIWVKRCRAVGQITTLQRSHDRWLLKAKKRRQRKPEFPPPEKREKIKLRRAPTYRYPRLGVTGGLLFRQMYCGKLNQSFRRLEQGYGFVSGQEFGGDQLSLNAGLRLYLSPAWSFWWECSPQPQFGFGMMALSCLYSPLRLAPLAVSLGAGPVWQNLRASRSYNQPIGEDTSGQIIYLERLELTTGYRLGWLLSGVVDFWGATTDSPGGLFLALKYALVPEFQDTMTPDEWGSETWVEAAMSALVVTCGFTFVFQL